MDALVCLRCRQLESRLDELGNRVASLEAENQRLRQALANSQRTGKRQAAPFSHGEPQAEPQKPGRKAGAAYGKKGHREPPAPEQIDETWEASLPDVCPDCGGPILETGVVPQFQVEIPRQPIHRQFNVHIGCCQGCGHRVQGHHPLQTSDALGAAAAQLGPDGQAAIALLNKRLGLSHGKVVRCLSDLFGIPLTRGGSAQVVLRAARRCQPAYAEIREATRASPRLRPDESGWRIGGHPAWLHVWVGEQATCYHIDPSRSADALEDLIGLDYEGILIHDGWSSYDRFTRAWHQQCLAHPLHRAHVLLETATRGAVRFPRQVIALLKEALDTRDRFAAGQLSRSRLRDARWDLTLRLADLVGPTKTNPDNERFAQHMHNHLDDWFTFLDFPGLDATNYRAEQAIRPAVVNRKVWGGNRTPAGAQAQSVLMSTIETCRQKARSALDFVSQTLRGIAGSILASPFSPRASQA
jgi:transposase